MARIQTKSDPTWEVVEDAEAQTKVTHALLLERNANTSEMNPLRANTRVFMLVDWFACTCYSFFWFGGTNLSLIHVWKFHVKAPFVVVLSDELCSSKPIFVASCATPSDDEYHQDKSRKSGDY